MITILYAFNEAVGRTTMTALIERWNGAEWWSLIDKYYDTR